MNKSILSQMRASFFGLLALSCSLSAQAGVISFDTLISLDIPQTSIPFSSTDSATVSLQQFNPLLGTLNSVSVDVTGGALNAQGSGFGFAHTIQITSQIEVEIVALSLSSLSPVVVATDSCLSGSVDTPFGSFPTPCNTFVTNTLGPTQFLVASTTAPLVAPEVSTYVGSGFFDVFVELTVDGSGLESNAYGLGSWTDGIITVTYDYTPSTVPEPSTLALLGIGLLGVALGRRRKLH